MLKLQVRLQRPGRWALSWGGGMLANVVGVPLGAFAGQVIGWRGPFWALAVLALAAAVVVYRLVPASPPETGPTPSVRAELASMRDARVWLVLAGCAIVCGSSLAAYSFISPLLTENTGLSASVVPLVLVAYGVGGRSSAPILEVTSAHTTPIRHCSSRRV